MSKTVKRACWIGGVAMAVLALAAGYWYHRFHRYTPVEVTLDIRAALGARHAPRRVERFLELRYGSMNDPANRQKAFLDFFNPGHIEGLQLLVRHMPAQMRQDNISGMAQWIADYRQSLSAEEKATLGAFFKSEAGQATLQTATSHYLRQDVYYRASSAQVVKELMLTLSTTQKQ